jgi:hypothetical protein
MLTGLRRRSSVICIVGVPVFHVPARPVLAVLAVDAPHPASIDRSHIRRIEARIPLMTRGPARPAASPSRYEQLHLTVKYS